MGKIHYILSGTDTPLAIDEVKEESKIPTEVPPGKESGKEYENTRTIKSASWKVDSLNKVRVDVIHKTSVRAVKRFIQQEFYKFTTLKLDFLSKNHKEFMTEIQMFITSCFDLNSESTLLNS